MRASFTQGRAWRVDGPDWKACCLQTTASGRCGSTTLVVCCLPPPEEATTHALHLKGTYGPDPTLLPKLKETLEYNFPGLKVEAFDYKDEELVKSKADMLVYARSKPGMISSPSQLADGVQQLDLGSTGSESVSAANGPGNALTAAERDLVIG